MSEKILLEILLILVGVIIVMLAFIWKGHDKKHEEIEENLNILAKQKNTCTREFASKESVSRAHKRIDSFESKFEDFSNKLDSISKNLSAINERQKIGNS